MGIFSRKKASSHSSNSFCQKVIKALEADLDHTNPLPLVPGTNEPLPVPLPLAPPVVQPRSRTRSKSKGKPKPKRKAKPKRKPKKVPLVVTYRDQYSQCDGELDRYRGPQGSGSRAKIVYTNPHYGRICDPCYRSDCNNCSFPGRFPWVNSMNPAQFQFLNNWNPGGFGLHHDAVDSTPDRASLSPSSSSNDETLVCTEANANIFKLAEVPKDKPKKRRGRPMTSQPRKRAKTVE